MNPNAVVAALIVTHALLAGTAVFTIVFLWYPDKLVFGKWGFFLTAAIIPTINYVGAHTERFLGVTKIYLEFLVRHMSLITSLTLAVIVGLVVGAAIMRNRIADRYLYVERINDAIKLLDTNQLGLPVPEDLAAAFELMPHRPEVPFILIRSSRLIPFDVRTDIFYFYMEHFFSRIDKDALAERSKDFKRPSKLSIGEEDPALPVLDPIQQLVNFYIEKDNSIPALEWAVATLEKYRNRPDDQQLILLRTILKTELDHLKTNDRADLQALTQAAIKSIEDQIDPAKTPGGFRSLPFATDHVYQEALDYLGWLKAGGPESKVTATPQCAPAEEVAAIFQQILVLRSRIVSRTDLIWWRPPTKLYLRYLYLHFSGQHGKISAATYDTFNKCPGLIDRLEKLYDAPAFKAFQDPEYWNYGTPLSSTFNGSAAITQLRQWLRLGW